jgi:multiple sugar transport system permease protein
LRRPSFWFLAPAVVWGLTFTLYPVLHALVLSFQRARLGQPETWIGFDNFVRTVSDPQFWDALQFTVGFVVVTVTIQMVVGMALALLLNRPMPFRGVVRAIIMLPLFATPVGIGYLGIAMFQETAGPINATLMQLGGALGFAPEAWDVPWRSHPMWATLAVGIMDTWQWMPFCFLILLAGIQALPDELYRAARLSASSGCARGCIHVANRSMAARASSAWDRVLSSVSLRSPAGNVLSRISSAGWFRLKPRSTVLTLYTS